MKSHRLMHWFRYGVTIAVLAAAGLGASCTSTQLGEAVELGLQAANQDPERARQAGEAARQLSGAAAPVDLQTEMSLGSGVAVQAFGRIGPLEKHQDLQRYVTLVGKAVARQGARPELPYAFAVLDNPAPNAFAGPGGYIFVTTGALRMMDSEAELAGVLAHEVAHVTERHMLKTYKRASFVEALSTGAQVLDQDVAQYTDMVDFASETLFDRGLDKRFEYEADLVGTQIAAMAGYDPDGLVNFLEKMQANTNQQGGWYSTHPPTSERIGRVKAMIAADLADSGGIEQRERFERKVRALLP